MTALRNGVVGLRVLLRISQDLWLMLAAILVSLLAAGWFAGFLAGTI